MGKGGHSETKAGKPLAKHANVGIFSTMWRVVTDFTSPQASSRADYYKVSAMDIKKKERSVPFGSDLVFTRAEVSEHSSFGDCWLIIKGKVYDVTDFAPQHPGGRVIYTYAGKDATDVFTAFHEGFTWSQLSQYQVGNLAGADLAQQVDPVVADFRALRTRMQQEGELH